MERNVEEGETSQLRANNATTSSSNTTGATANNTRVRAKPDPILATCRCFSFVTVLASILCIVVNVLSAVRSFKNGSDIFDGIFRCYAVAIAVFVIVAETEWAFVIKFWKAFRGPVHVVTLGLLQRVNLCEFLALAKKGQEKQGPLRLKPIGYASCAPHDTIGAQEHVPSYAFSIMDDEVTKHNCTKCYLDRSIAQFRCWPKQPKLQLLEYWAGRGMLQIFVAVMTRAYPDIYGERHEVLLLRDIATYSLLACGLIYVVSGVLCLGFLKRARQNKEVSTQQAIKDLEDLERRRAELEALLVVENP